MGKEVAGEEGIVKLDLKDRQLMFELDFDARAPYSKLAKKLRLSKQGVEYKLQNLMRKGVVGGFYPLIHSQKLGYIYCRLLITLQNADEKKRTEIYGYLKAHPRVFWLFRMHGQYDIAFMTWCKSLREFEGLVHEFEGKFGGFIKQKRETVATDVVHFQSRFLTGKVETRAIHLDETGKKVVLDKTDEKIIEALCEDARMPIVKIAKNVGESAKVVAYRLKKMEGNGVILGYRPIIDYNRLGYTYYKLFISLNNISATALGRLNEYLKAQPVVLYTVEGIGLTSNLEVELMVKNNAELFDFIERLRTKFPTMISEYQTVVFREMLKVKYAPF